MERFPIDADLVRSLLREQHPDLAHLALREVDGGWDNQVWRLGDRLAVRMPRTARAPDLLRKEHRWLPELAPHLPLPVPGPVRIGEPSARFPRPWTIATWVPGEPADRAPVTRGDHAADRLAAFLAALHREAPPGAPANPDRGVPLHALGVDPTELFRPGHESDGTGRTGPLLARAREVWERAVAAPAWQGPPLWLHGDLHPANVVVDGGTLTGVLDFGEMCGGDPATDLSAAWLLLPAGAAPRFLAAYAKARAATPPSPVPRPPVSPYPDEATILRARGWAVLRAVGLIGIGRAGELGLPGGKPTWGPAGRAALDRVLGSTPGRGRDGGAAVGRDDRESGGPPRLEPADEVGRAVQPQDVE